MIILNESNYTGFHISLAFIIIMIMASLHNLIKSILIYKAKTSKLINTLKIILNLCGLTYGIINIGLLFTQFKNNSLTECFTAVYLQLVTNFLFTELITILLILKLKQYGKLMDYFGYFLLLTRSLLYILFIPSTRPNITSYSGCNGYDLIDNGVMYIIGAITADVVIDTYFIINLTHYTRKYLKSNKKLPKKSLIWNVLIISLMLVQQVNLMILTNPAIIGYIIQIVIFTLLLYLITFNFGELENSTNGERLEEDLESTSNISNTSEDVVLRASNGMLVNMSLNDVRDEIKMEQGYNIERIDSNEGIGVSQQSLTFYEVISMFLGKSDKRQSV